MDFIKELHEARLTRAGGSLKTLTYTDCCERAYLTILICEVLRRFPSTTAYAHGYAKKTSGYNYDYEHFRMNGTDLYNFIYFIMGDEEAMNKLKDPGAAKRKRASTQFPMMRFNRYIKNLATGRAITRLDMEDILNIESSLGITNADYKNVRRNLTGFATLSTKDKKATVTRLLLAARAKLRNSDIIQYLEQLSAVRDLELSNVVDPEPKVSIPDISTTGRDMLAYNKIVGTENLMMAKRFLELAKDGKSIPSNVVKAYLPAIALIDEIAKAGPGYVQMLRTLANRAKNSTK